MKYKWIIVILIGVFLSLCGIIWGFVINDIKKNTNEIEKIKEKDVSSEIIIKLNRLEDLMNEKMLRLEQKIDLLKPSN